MPTFVYALIAAFVLADVIIFGGLWFIASHSKANRPDNVGHGHLAEGSAKPNWVSSVTRDESKLIEPLIFTGDPAIAWEAAKEAVAELPKTKLVTTESEYLHAECSSPIFGFVDDLELLLRPNSECIDIRSASRVGHSDLGANAQRVEKLRTMFEA
ncbi:MAG: DUF1499 domain-containing protein, partial [Verrucomicrobiales bacterium]|nr:DUF1499 domain-containing protein [Verrucomicrobiales bacterium]